MDYFFTISEKSESLVQREKGKSKVIGPPFLMPPQKFPPVWGDPGEKKKKRKKSPPQKK